MAIRITPLYDRVLVRRLKDKEIAEGGLVIPDIAKEKPQEGEVVAVGAGTMEHGHRTALDVKVGDRILLGQYPGNEIRIDDHQYLIVHEKDILAKLDRAV